MKTLGILGGMGPMASQLLYQKITTHTKASCDQEHLNLLLYSHCTLPDRSQGIQEGKTQELVSLLGADLTMLEKMGAEVLAIPCNTCHHFLSDLQEVVGITILNMINLTVEAVAKRNPKKVAILATEGTHHSRLYENKLQEQGIASLEMPCHLQDRVNQLIYAEIKGGKAVDLANFQEIEAYLWGQEVDCVVLACTELSVFQAQHPLPSCYIDALDVLCGEAILHCGGTLIGEEGLHR